MRRNKVKQNSERNRYDDSGLQAQIVKNINYETFLASMNLEDSGDIEDATAMFNKAWHEATDDYEKFIAAYHLARQQKRITDKLKWMETSLQYALNINDYDVIRVHTQRYI